MSNKKLILEQYSDEIDLFRLANSYYQKNGLEMTVKVLSKIIETLENRKKGHRAPHVESVQKKKKKESKEGAGAYDAPAFSMEPDHVHFKKTKNRF